MGFAPEAHARLSRALRTGFGCVFFFARTRNADPKSLSIKSGDLVGDYRDHNVITIISIPKSMCFLLLGHVS